MSRRGRKAKQPELIEIDPEEEQVDVRMETEQETRTTLPEHLEKRDISLFEFMNQMENFEPILPDAVLDYYLHKSGFDCPDHRIKKLLALAAQKFITDIASDAYAYSKMRQQNHSKDNRKQKDKKTVLTMEDLSAALNEYGVQVKKPDYYT